MDLEKRIYQGPPFFPSLVFGPLIDTFRCLFFVRALEARSLQLARQSCYRIANKDQLKKPSFVSFPLINRGLFTSSFQEITSFEKDQKFGKPLGFLRPTQKIHLESLSTGKMQSHQTNKTSQVKDLSFCFGRQKSFKNWLGVRQGQYQ